MTVGEEDLRKHFKFESMNPHHNPRKSHGGGVDLLYKESKKPIVPPLNLDSSKIVFNNNSPRNKRQQN